MKQRVKQWKERFDALSLRERSLVVLGILVLAHSGWNLGPMRILQKQQHTLLSEIKKSRKAIRDIDNKIQVITAEFAPQGRAEAMRRIKRLKSEIARINEVKKDVTVGFIRPRQMVEVLKGLLNKEPGLKLISFQSQEVEPLFKQQGAGQQKPGSRNVQTASTRLTDGSSRSPSGRSPAPSYPEVYKHGVVIQFSGTYRSTVHYLQSLESLPWKFYWDGLAYEVRDYPKALITINVFTLSLEKGWIGV